MKTRVVQGFFLFFIVFFDTYCCGFSCVGWVIMIFIVQGCLQFFFTEMLSIFFSILILLLQFVINESVGIFHM